MTLWTVCINTTQKAKCISEVHTKLVPIVGVYIDPCL